MANTTILDVKIISDGSSAAKGFRQTSTAADVLDRNVSKTSKSFGELGDRQNLARDGFGDLSTAASALASGLGAAGIISEDMAAKLSGTADILGGLEGGFTAVKGASSLAGTAFANAGKSTGKMTVAQKAATVAQRALNAVLRANPIGLIVTAIALLVGGLVLAYKRSETFRTIVNAVKDSGVAAFKKIWEWVQKVIDKVQAVVGWIKRIKFPSVPKAISNLTGGAGGAPGWDGGAGGSAYSSLPGRGGPGGGGFVLPVGGGFGGGYIVINVNGVLDPNEFAKRIEQLLRRRGIRFGGAL